MRCRSGGSTSSCLHVTARTGRAGRQVGGLHRHVRDPVGPGVQLWNKLRLASPARAVVEVASTCALAPAVVLAEAALYSELVTPSSLKRAANQLDHGRPRAHRVLAHALAAHSVAPSASVAESRLRLILTEAGLPSPSSSPPPAAAFEDATLDLSGCSLWFPDERTVIEFEPRYPFWTKDLDDYLEDADERLFGVPTIDPAAEPEPLEYCWISWPDLDDPALVVDRVRTAFTRATRRTAIHLFDPTRPRRKPPQPKDTRHFTRWV